jgi:hypothetical protein
MSSDLIIRTVTPQDYAQWLPLWDGYNAFYGRAGATALAPEITRTTWARFFDAYEPVHALVAARGDELLGLTHYLFTAAPPRSGRTVICRTCSPAKPRAAKASAEL